MKAPPKQRIARDNFTPDTPVSETHAAQGKISQSTNLTPRLASQSALHRMVTQSSVVQRQKTLRQMTDPASPTLQRKESSDLPDDLRSGIESLSGVAMDGVRVHRNATAPAQVNAHAFAQGNAIHLAPGQDNHLPHEAWHVVQQRQGRVAPTTTLTDGTAVNDDPALEREADQMGAAALQRQKE
ncbi:DUF4157 domain-containing protein [uncultured Roseovarius sp.]|uniref:eCIS core domain-containing protein n=1 Tax=uncultured Roseovarius sp. TaxID=293344 RepID=UPI0026333C57|nr:DUF4157 domain-containing protein [uncultured Roseovarius sp.]